jgi:hypothetical protein
MVYEGKERVVNSRKKGRWRGMPIVKVDGVESREVKMWCVTTRRPGASHFEAQSHRCSTSIERQIQKVERAQDSKRHGNWLWPLIRVDGGIYSVAPDERCGPRVRGRRRWNQTTAYIHNDAVASDTILHSTFVRIHGKELESLVKIQDALWRSST